MAIHYLRNLYYLQIKELLKMIASYYFLAHFLLAFLMEGREKRWVQNRRFEET